MDAIVVGSVGGGGTDVWAGTWDPAGRATKGWKEIIAGSCDPKVILLSPTARKPLCRFTVY